MEHDAITVVLEGLGAEYLIPIFKENNIGLNTLPLLTDGDLKALGIEDATLRENLLKHGYSRQKQICKEQYIPITGTYTQSILSDINRHMRRLEANLLTSYIRLNKAKQPIDPLVSPNLYSSQACLKSMKILMRNLTKMENEVKELESSIKHID